MEAWAAAYPAIDFAARRGWLLDRLERMEAEGARILVAEVEGSPAGFVTVAPDGWIDQMLVGLAAQGSGVAAALMAAAKAASPSGLDLDVNADNARAIAFYRRAGFVTTGHRLNEQGRPVDLMAWRPEPPALRLRPS
ncbi:GNAT family N-acetyltransferase [Phreatobacter sp.]|uniref:GNAT family N-acetyltransferase n=1 Tax=Phreatobacter sp. TaxID=1966341 RepID=UPI0022C63C20|nr:GNAT family N-acetyltransferase [Phreatobacter sp.]MCZ8313407.1 GNAT family N-acetyltransferase [Phreatobacter sp.]